MRHKTSSVILGLLALSISCSAQAQSEAFFSLVSSDHQTQGMAMVLATQMMEQKTTVRVLLCGPAGQLALRTYEPPVLKPRQVSPKQMMQSLMKAGASVEVCALFLPNADRTASDLLEGISVAKPPEVAAHMLKPSVRVFGY